MKSFQLLTILTIILGLGLIVSCEETTNTEQSRWYPPEKKVNEEKNKATPQTIWGHWVCSNFIDLVKVRRTVRGIRSRPMFLEIVFKPEFGDSALLITGYTNFLAPYTRQGEDSIILKNISAGKNLILFAKDGLQRLELPDSSQGKDAENKVYAWSFTKTSNIKKGKTKDVSKHINAGVISGTYSNATNNTVTFSNNGDISGWNGFSNYEICSGGDCFMLTRSPLDIITLTQAGKKQHYAFWIKSNDSLYFYNLTKKSNAKQYNYQPEDMAYAFKKVK